MGYSEFDTAAEWNGKLCQRIWLPAGDYPLPFRTQCMQVGFSAQRIEGIGIEMEERYTGKSIGGQTMFLEVKQIVFHQQVPFRYTGLKTEITAAVIGPVILGIGCADLSVGKVGK